jgi:hypothetical protein
LAGVGAEGWVFEKAWEIAAEFIEEGQLGVRREVGGGVGFRQKPASSETGMHR